MPLTAQEQAALEALQAKASEPEPRTETGRTGVLHTLIDLVSGRLPHIAPGLVDQLHTQAEYDGDPPESAAGDEDPAATSPAAGP